MLGEQALLTFRDGRIDGSVDVAQATPEQIRSLWAECPLSGATIAHMEAHGAFPSLDVAAHAAMGGSVVDVAGPIVFAHDVRADLHFAARGIDLHTLVTAAPKSDLAATGDASLTRHDGGALDGSVAFSFAGGRVASVPLPPALVRAEFARSAAGEPSGRAELSIAQAGAPTVLRARLASSGGSLAIAFEGAAEVPRLEALGPLGGTLAGSANVSATGTLDVTHRRIDARVSASVARASMHWASLEHARIEVNVHGPAGGPSCDVEVDGEGIDARGVHLSAASARGRVTFEGGVEVRDVEIDVAGNGEAAHARSPWVHVARGDIRVEDAVVDGLGAPVHAAIHASASAVEVRARSDGIDLARLATFVPWPTTGGKVSLDVDASVASGEAHGRVAVEVQHVAFPGVDDATARIEAGVDGRHAWGRATASVGDVGTADVRSSSVHIGPGALLTASPWRKAWGALQVAAHVDLAHLADRIPGLRSASGGVLGSLDVQGQVARDSASDATPEVELTARTTGLVLVRPWRIQGIDPTLHATVDGNTGDSTIELQAKDAGGILATLDAHSSAVPYAVVFSDDDPIEALSKTPFDAKLVVPSRGLDSLPAALHAGGIGGRAEGTLTWHGAAFGPTLDLFLALKGARPLGSVLDHPIDWALGAHYDGAQVKATLQGTSHARRVIDGSVQAQAQAGDVIAALRGGPMPWSASAQAKLDRFPLQDVTALGDRMVQGDVTGEISLEGLHSDAHATMAFAVEGLRVGDVACRSSSLNGHLDGHALDATVRVDQTDGFASATAHLGAHWGSATLPAIDVSQPAELSLSAKHLGRPYCCRSSPAG